MDLLKKLYCKHDYEYEYKHMANGGMAKMYKLICKKCGKIKYKTF